jgi:hypothetical protein
MATSPVGPGDISLRDFIEAVGSAEAPHGAVSTAALAGSLGTSLLLTVAALPQTRSDSVADRAKLVEAAAALTSVQQQLIETIETETAVKLFTARSMPQASDAQRYDSERYGVRSCCGDAERSRGCAGIRTHCDDGCDDAGWSHAGADGGRKRSGDAYAEGRYGVWIPSDDSGQCTMESNCRDHLQECDDQRADGRSRRNRSPERRSGNGFENESFLQSVCSQGIGSNLAN